MFLEMKNITKSFSGNQILFDVSLQIRPQTVHGLIGPNGSGKSTIVNILSGLYPPDSGEICWLGKPLEHFSPHETLKRGIFTLYQDHQLIPQLSIMDNLFLGIYEKKYGIFCDRKKWNDAAARFWNIFSAIFPLLWKQGGLQKAKRK